MAVLVGIGLDVKYRRHLSFRAIQADYGYTRLPNLSGNDQNLLQDFVQVKRREHRLAGIVEDGDLLHGAGRILSGLGAVTEVPKVT